MLKNHPHPGELLREEVLLPLGIEVTEAAHRLGVARTTARETPAWQTPPAPAGSAQVRGR